MKDLNKMLESLSDDEWSAVTLRINSKRALLKAETFKKMKLEAICFANWIIKHSIEPNIDADSDKCWIKRNENNEDEIETFTSQELYTIYFLGEWDEISDEEY